MCKEELRLTFRFENGLGLEVLSTYVFNKFFIQNFISLAVIPEESKEVNSLTDELTCTKKI